MPVCVGWVLVCVFVCVCVCVCAIVAASYLKVCAAHLIVHCASTTKRPFNS